MPSKNYGQIGVGSDVEYGKGGPRVKDNSGIFELKNNADDAFAVVRGADPVNDNDLVTLQYLRTKASVVVTGQIDGLDPAAVVNGAVYIVTSAGGGYSLGELYYGKGGSWTAITVTENLSISVSDDLTGETDEYQGDHIYTWDADNTEWDDLGPAPAETKVVKSQRANLVFNSGASVNIGSAVPTNARPHKVVINVTQAFNGTSESTVEIGDAGDGDRLMTTAEIDLHTVGIYVADINHNYTSETQLVATYVQDSASQGVATIEVLYSIA